MVAWQNAAILAMPFGNHGTLLSIVERIVKNKLSASLQSEQVAVFFGHQVDSYYWQINVWFGIMYIYLSICAQMLDCMLHLHSCGILHGDVKADNWMVHVSDGRSLPQLKLIDFGKSRFLYKYSSNDDNKEQPVEKAKPILFRGTMSSLSAHRLKLSNVVTWGAKVCLFLLF